MVADLPRCCGAVLRSAVNGEIMCIATSDIYREQGC